MRWASGSTLSRPEALTGAIGPATIVTAGPSRKRSLFEDVRNIARDFSDEATHTPHQLHPGTPRSILMTALKHHLARAEMSQAQAAALLGVTQPRISV